MENFLNVCRAFLIYEGLCVAQQVVKQVVNLIGVRLNHRLHFINVHPHAVVNYLECNHGQTRHRLR